MKYSSPLRAEQARLTQRRITDAALELFLAHGYSSTTMAAVAKSAGVSAQTVYNTFGTKAALLKRVYDIALIGDDEPIPMIDRPELQALIAEQDPRRYLMGYVALGRVLNERVGRFVVMLTAGAAHDPDLAAHVTTINGERLFGTGLAAKKVHDLGALRPDLTVEQARDRIWTLNSVEVWHLLTELRGWSGEEYEHWIGEAMCDAVLIR